MQAINPEEMTGLHLFYHPLSNCAMRALLLMQEKGLKFEKHKMNLLKNEQLSEEYRAITEKCEVPAIIHQGIAMLESIDIMRYLEQAFPMIPFTPRD